MGNVQLNVGAVPIVLGHYLLLYDGTMRIYYIRVRE